MRNWGITIAGILFILMALLHLARLFCPFPVVIGTYSVPEWFSYIGFVFFGMLAAWQFRAPRPRTEL
jgi:hypothetical protein